MSNVILITGTRKGIGKELAQYYLKNSWNVIGCSRGETTISDKSYQHYQFDVSDEKSVIKIVREVSRKFGKIDVLLNNAGIASMNHLLLTPIDKAKDIFNTNFFGSFLLMREVGKIMTKKKNGRIVNFTTVAVPLNLDGEAIYAASKAAVESLTKISAKELAPYGITVNAVGPSPVKTDLIKVVPKDKISDLVSKQAIKRLGEFNDVVNVINFFIDKNSNFITGQIIYLGGISG